MPERMSGDVIAVTGVESRKILKVPKRGPGRGRVTGAGKDTCTTAGLETYATHYFASLSRARFSEGVNARPAKHAELAAGNLLCNKLVEVFFAPIAGISSAWDLEAGGIGGCRD